MAEGLLGLLLWLALVLVLAIATHIVFILLYPYVVMAVAFHKAAKQLGLNTLTHGEKPTAAFRAVVRPSPDLIYSGCVFDLAGGPLHIRALVPNTYMSLSLYASNTDNFFSINDSEIGTSELNITLIGPNTPRQGLERLGSGQVIHCPSTKGILLFRYFYGDGTQVEEIERVRRQTVLSRSTQPEYALSKR